MRKACREYVDDTKTYIEFQPDSSKTSLHASKSVIWLAHFENMLKSILEQACTHPQGSDPQKQKLFTMYIGLGDDS